MTRGRLWRRPIVVGIALLALLGAGAAAADPPTGVRVNTYEDWLHDSAGWTEHSGYLHSDDDGLADVVVASAARPWGYWYFAGGNPSVAARGFSTAADVFRDAATLRSLDGRTGKPLWVHTWQPEAVLPGQVTDWHFVEGVLAGSLDEVPGDEVLVLRRALVKGDDGEWSNVEITSLHDGATGKVRWEHSVPSGELFTMRRLVPAPLGARTGAVVNRYAFRPGNEDRPDSAELGTDVVVVDRKGLVTLGSLPTAKDVYGYVQVAPLAGGLRLFSSTFRIVNEANGLDTAGVLTATDIRFGDQPRVATRWSRRGFGTAAMTVVGGIRPALVLSRDNGTFALEPENGKQRWRHEAAGRTFDPSAAVGDVDVNGDGVRDVVVSPALGETAFRDDFTTEIYALDGTSGTVMWERFEPTGKFGARSFAAVDLDGDGRQELAAAMLQHDGHPFVGNFDDDPAQLAVYDLGDGDHRCTFPLERLPSRLDTVRIHDGWVGEQVQTVGLSGLTSVIGYRYPLCDARS